jgi:hypothetical protein
MWPTLATAAHLKSPLHLVSACIALRALGSPPSHRRTAARPLSLRERAGVRAPPALPPSQFHLTPLPVALTLLWLLLWICERKNCRVEPSHWLNC